MKNLVLFIAVMLLYGSNVTAQTIPTALTGNTLTIDIPAEVYAKADIHDIVFNANIHDIVFNANIHDIVFNDARTLDVAIYTTDDRQVYSEKLKATTVITLDTQDLPKASYILRLRIDGGQTFTSEFVKL